MALAIQSKARREPGTRAFYGLHRALAVASLLALAPFGGCDVVDCPEDDHDACTIDLCEGGATAHKPLPPGTICYVGANPGTCEDGACMVPCKTEAECDDKNPCTSDGCDKANGVCVHIADDAIVPPDDGNDCTGEVCIGGKAYHFPKAGEPCGDSKGICQGVVCSACATAEECGKTSVCVTWTCESGACMPKYVDEGLPVPSEDVLGDCRSAQCDGNGGVAYVPYDQDKPEDENPCTQEVCAGGTPFHEMLPSGTWCPPSQVCNGQGACVTCTADLHCGGSPSYCWQESCHSCANLVQDGNETGVDCGGSCRTCNGDPCLSAGDCASGVCADGVCCDSACGTCFTCVLLGSAGKCKFVPKYGEEAPSCLIADDEMCNGTGSCKTALGAACGASFECASGKCTGGVCVLP